MKQLKKIRIKMKKINFNSSKNFPISVDFVDFYKCKVKIVLSFTHMINSLNFTHFNSLNFTNDTITAKLSASSINH